MWRPDYVPLPKFGRQQTAEERAAEDALIAQIEVERDRAYADTMRMVAELVAAHRAANQPEE